MAALHMDTFYDELLSAYTKSLFMVTLDSELLSALYCTAHLPFYIDTWTVHSACGDTEQTVLFMEKGLYSNNMTYWNVQIESLIQNNNS